MRGRDGRGRGRDSILARNRRRGNEESLEPSLVGETAESLGQGPIRSSQVLLADAQRVEDVGIGKIENAVKLDMDRRQDEGAKCPTARRFSELCRADLEGFPRNRGHRTRPWGCTARRTGDCLPCPGCGLEDAGARFDRRGLVAIGSAAQQWRGALSAPAARQPHGREATWECPIRSAPRGLALLRDPPGPAGVPEAVRPPGVGLGPGATFPPPCP